MLKIDERIGEMQQHVVYSLMNQASPCEGCGSSGIHKRQVYGQWLCTRCMASIENALRR